MLFFFLTVEKTELFLELFGNSLVRPQASEYLQQKSTDFIRYLLNCKVCLAPLTDSGMYCIHSLIRCTQL